VATFLATVFALALAAAAAFCVEVKEKPHIRVVIDTIRYSRQAYEHALGLREKIEVPRASRQRPLGA
jgi:hypothetical protein